MTDIEVPDSYIFTSRTFIFHSCAITVPRESHFIKNCTKLMLFVSFSIIRIYFSPGQDSKVINSFTEYFTPARIILFPGFVSRVNH